MSKSKNTQPAPPDELIPPDERNAISKNTQPAPNNPKPPDEPIPPDERNAMRVYLQRAEVRLSTMHRVAGIFLNGAGLLILFPLLFKDVVREMMVILATKISFTLASAYYLLLIVPFVISLGLPLYSLYLLLKDLVEFYFAGNFPGYEIPTPRFVIPASVLPPDEAKLPKQKVLEFQYGDGPGKNLRKFVLPFDDEDEAENKYYDFMIKMGIIPQTRSMEELKISPPSYNNENEEKLFKEKQRFSAIFGLSGAYDRNLVEEVAFTEVLLSRHASSLRRLVLRYAKALLVVIWTILVSFSTVAVVQAVQQQYDAKADIPYLMMIVAGLYLVWATGTYFVVKLPLQWIREMTRLPQVEIKVEGSSSPNMVSVLKKEVKEDVKELLRRVKDAQIQKFENRVEWMCWIAGGAASLFLVVHIVLFILNYVPPSGP